MNTNYMDGYYGLPAGKVEKLEGFLAAAVREAKEEVGVDIRPEDLEFRFMFWRRALDQPGMEWCDAVFYAKNWRGEPHNAEPHMHEEIAWFALDALPENVVPAIRQMLAAIQRGDYYGEYDDGGIEK
jgi:8-oxo-dGTP pyrophosphatase MutT (NUDIX family)